MILYSGLNRLVVVDVSIKKLKLFLTYSAIIGVLGSGGYMKFCRDKANDFSAKTKNYISEFEDDDFEIAAHRGCTFEEVENTMPALKAASEAGFVDYIELDTRLSGDGKLVVAHNSSVNEDWFSSTNISKTNSFDLENGNYRYSPPIFDDFVKSFFNPTEGVIIQERLINTFGKEFSVPSIDDAIKACGDKTILIDLKFSNNQARFYETIKEFLAKNDGHNIILQSADLDALRALQVTFPQYKYLAIVDSEDDFSKCITFDILGVRKNLINTPDVMTYLEDGKKLSVWTVNSIEDVDLVMEATGDYATELIYVTDYPQIVATHLGESTLQKKKVTN